MKFRSGDYVEVTTHTDVIKATIVNQDDNLILKLDNGYNIGVKTQDIKDIRLLRPFKQEPKAKKTAKENEKLKKISILHTGGTIASKVDYRTGAVFSSFTPEDILSQVPELKNIANFNSRLISNMWSDDLRFKHFSLIAKEIEKEAKKGVEGIIIGIGTDNLSVASAALSFIVEETPIPIVLVGAQRSSDRGSSDAAMNLVCASKFIVNTDFAGVAICMHDSMSDDFCSIFPACKTKKLHSSRRDAFKAVNDTTIARISFKTDEINFNKSHYKKKGGKLILNPSMEEKVGLIKIHINMFASEFKAFKGFKGLIIEGTGLGHTPLDVIDKLTKEHSAIKKALEDLIKSGTVIVMTTTCLFGKVDMQVYSKGRDLLNIGVISGEDMLSETAFVKLSWLSGNYKQDKVKELIKKNLRGEINERITAEFSL